MRAFSVIRPERLSLCRHLSAPSLLCGVWLLLLTVAVSGLQAVQAQHLAHGTITDALTGLPLPSANVVIDGTYRGTITNADGAYQLESPDAPVDLVVRYIGYQSQRRTMADLAVQELNFALQPVTYQMPELVVTDDNPAIPIMQCVIARKQVWRASLTSYAAEAYTRFTVSNDTGIVSIVESLSDVFWERGRGTREIVKSQRQTTNLDLSTHMPAAQFVANLYDDDIEVAGFTFVGVTHPQAFETYRFDLADTRMMDDRLVYDITVAPRNRLKTGFTGRLAVLADACALLEVELTPGEAFLFPPPIKTLDITFFQQFNQFDGEAWLPADFRSDIVLEISMGFLMSFPPFRVRQTSRLSNYDVDVQVPDTLFDREAGLVVDDLAVQADTLLSQAGSAVPLDSLERLAYRTIDSTMTIDRAFAPSGALARVAEMDSDDDEADSDRPGPRFRAIDRLHLTPILRFNRVESFHGGLSTEHALGRWRLHAGAGWSAGLQRDPWSYDGGVQLRIGSRERGFVGATYLDDVQPRYRSTAYASAMTSLYALVGGGDYHDYLSMRRARLRGGYEYEKWSVEAAVQVERPLSVVPTTAYDLLGRPGTPQPNEPIQHDDVRSVIVSVGVGEAQNTLGFLGKRYLGVEIEQGTTDQSGAFTRVRLEADWRSNTLFRRRMLPNVLDLHLTAGTYWGTLPVHRRGIVDGSLGAYRPFGVLRTRTGRPYEGERYAGLFWEHSFRTVPFEIVGLRELARRGYGLILTGGHARTWIDDDALTGSDVARPITPDRGHHELGMAVTGLFGVLRADVALRLDAPGVTIGMSAARLF